MRGTPSLLGRSSQLGPIIPSLSPLAAITRAEKEQSCASGRPDQTSAPLSVLEGLSAFSAASVFNTPHIRPKILLQENPAGFSPEG